MDDWEAMAAKARRNAERRRAKEALERDELRALGVPIPPFEPDDAGKTREDYLQEQETAAGVDLPPPAYHGPGSDPHLPLSPQGWEEWGEQKTRAGNHRQGRSWRSRVLGWFGRD